LRRTDLAPSCQLDRKTETEVGLMINSLRGDDVMKKTMKWAWLVVRFPILTMLVILEPIVAFILGGLALFGVLVTLFFKLIDAPRFPTWTMLALSLGFVGALVIYEAAIRLLSTGSLERLPTD
jgi:hypothetical protein